MQLNSFVLCGGLIYIDGKFYANDIEVVNGMITKIGPSLSGSMLINIEGKIVTPGFIDTHVHLRDPGYLDAEDIGTGSFAAIRGGYTTVIAMANTRPIMDNDDEIEKFYANVDRRGFNDIRTMSAITVGLDGKELVDFQKNIDAGCIAFSDDGMGIVDDRILEKGLLFGKKFGKVFSLHAEFGGLSPYDPKSEYAMVARDLKILEETLGKINFCHISTKESVDLIRKAKKKGLDVSCEVTPHHVTLTLDDIKNCDPLYKMNPPLRTRDDVDALIDGLNDGTIEIIATDHAPHTELEKKKN
jgi:dihydroorotase